MCETFSDIFLADVNRIFPLKSNYAWSVTVTEKWTDKRLQRRVFRILALTIRFETVAKKEVSSGDDVMIDVDIKEAS